MRFYLGLALALMTSTVALAQTTTTNAVTTILHADGVYRPVVSGVVYVNVADCAATDSVVASVTVSSTLKTTLGSAPQIWVGTNCYSQLSRNSSNGTCVQASSAGPALVNTGGGYDISLTRLRPADSTQTTYDLCNTSSQGKKTFYLLPEMVGSSDTASYVAFSVTSDLTAPSSVTITTTAPSGDNAIHLDWSGTVDSGSVVTYFAAPGSCSSGADGGSTSTSLVAGGDAPLTDTSIETGTAGAGGSGDIASSALGLATLGDSTAIALAVHDAAYNYSVLSNVVCATRISTVGLCDSLGKCNGGCRVAHTPGGPTPLDGAVGIPVVLALALGWRRRR